MIRWLVVIGAVAGLLGGGCAGDAPIPSYLSMVPADALTLIAQRQASISTVTAECDLELTDARGETVSLDGVLVASLTPPTKLRLRAWKFGTAVFDLTLTSGKAWVMVPESGPAAGKIDIQSMPARRVSDAFDLLGPAFFRGAAVVREDADTLVARGSALGRDDVLCEIDRQTLTARRFVVGDGAAASELRLDRYTLSDAGPVWPRVLRLRSAMGEVVVTTRELEVNGEVPPEAFVPPRRAVELR
ncbi:MAG TPA: hypothetical protein VFF65_08790 [Phycisphaerales bacterium]|nr:hypothetical protein [Phycisphaerales bacterium]